MNKNVVLAVAKRDLKSWFGNPTGYMFIILFVVLSVGLLLWPVEFWRNNLANLDTLNSYFPALAVLFCSAITMGTWSNERSNGTQELLFTLPARDSELLLGKYLAAFGVYTLSLVFLLTLPLGLSLLGTPDWGQLISNFLGFWLLGAALVASSMIGSQLSENATLSLIYGAIVSGAVAYVGWLVRQIGGGSFLQLNGPQGQFQEFARGMVTTSGILLFVGLTVTFLYLNLTLLARRHHRAGDLEGLHGTLRFAALAVATGALTVVGVNALPRIDSTVERIHSLSSESKKLLAELDPKKPVFVTAFVTEEVPPQLVQQKRALLNLMDQFDRIGGDAVQQRVELIEPFSAEAQAAEKNYGIGARTMPSDDGGAYSESTVILGFVVQSGTEEVVVPFLEPALPLEYELTRSIRVVAKADRRTVGVLKTDVELYGGFDFQTFAQKPRWQIVDDLQLQYKIENVDADKEYPETLDALVVPQPSSLGQEQMDRLQNWILAGNAALLLEDPAPMSAPGTAATDQKGGARAQMMGGGGPQKGNFAGLMSSIGVQMPVDQVLWDTSYRTFAGGMIRDPEIVFVGEHGFAQDDPVTAGLDRAVVLLGGFFKPQTKEGWTFKPLMSSPMPDLLHGDLNGVVPKLELFVFNPFGGGMDLDPRRRQRKAPADYAIAARVTGPAKDGKKPPRAIVCADLDMFGNQFFQIRRAYADANMRFDNVAFVLNCIDSLVGDESLIELRKHRPMLRSLTRVEDAQREFENRWLEEKDKAEEAAKGELDKAQARLDEAVAAVRDNKELDEQAKEIQIQTIQNNENRKLEIAKAKIEDSKRSRIELARHQRDSEKTQLYNQYRMLMLLLAPLPALAMGLVTFVRRSARESAIVPQNRMVK